MGLQMKYFVLEPKGADQYAIASRCAVWAYADAIRAENPELAADLMEWWDRETLEARAEIRRKGEQR